MVYVHSRPTWARETEVITDIIADMPQVGARSQTRRERIHGLGIKGFDAAGTSSSKRNEPKPLRRRASARRSIVSYIARSVESQFAEKFGQARASSSHSNQSTSPPPSTISPTLWRTSNPSTTSLQSDSSVEDLSTYHANLARFKAERAQRELELGLSNYDLCRVEAVSSTDSSPTKGEPRKSSNTTLGKGLRAYWGGGSGSEARGIPSVSKASTIADPYWDEKSDREAFKDWFDKLGTEQSD